MYSTRSFQLGLSEYLKATSVLTHTLIPKVLATWGRLLYECVVGMYSFCWNLNICNADCFILHAFVYPLLFDMIPFYFLLTFFMQNGFNKREVNVQNWTLLSVCYANHTDILLIIVLFWRLKLV